MKSTKSDYFRLKNQLKKVDYFGQKNKLKRPALLIVLLGFGTVRPISWEWNWKWWCIHRTFLFNIFTSEEECAGYTIMISRWKKPYFGRRILWWKGRFASAEREHINTYYKLRVREGYGRRRRRRASQDVSKQGLARFSSVHVLR
jgi:hypothetical protein